MAWSRTVGQAIAAGRRSARLSPLATGCAVQTTRASRSARVSALAADSMSTSAGFVVHERAGHAEETRLVDTPQRLKPARMLRQRLWHPMTVVPEGPARPQQAEQTPWASSPAESHPDHRLASTSQARSCCSPLEPCPVEPANTLHVGAGAQCLEPPVFSHTRGHEATATAFWLQPTHALSSAWPQGAAALQASL